MTPLSRTIITIGVILFTTGTLVWITTGNAQWFAGGGAIFLGTILAGIVLSIEIKSNHHHSTTQTYQEPDVNIHHNDPFSS